jgi:hypothetical protein
MPRVVEISPPRRPAYFWWLLANALALSFAVISWTVCLHIFRNPEMPRNYEILRKIGRLPELKRHTVLNVPNGNLLDPKGLYSRFFPFTGDQLARFNTRLMRNYLTNFEHPLALTYIEGDYRVDDVRLLDTGDFIKQGFAIRARALVKPDDFTKPAPYPVVIEYIFPTTETSAVRAFRKDDVLSVSKSPNCAAILHIGRVLDGDEPLVCLTVVPIAYSPYRAGDQLTFGIEPPTEVNPAGRLPLFKK